MMSVEKYKDIVKSPIFRVAVISFLAGILWFISVRLITYRDETTHFHANFGLFINGEREQFSESTFYEEVSSCGSEENSPLTRVHMHDQIFDVAHVHDPSSTWGNFFENLGFTLGDNVLYARTNTYVDGQQGKLMFMLNGERVRNISAKTITSEDVLLISFDKNTNVLEEQYQQINASAAEYNETADPSACSGSDEPGIVNRLKEILGL